MMKPCVFSFSQLTNLNLSCNEKNFPGKAEATDHYITLGMS